MKKIYLNSEFPLLIDAVYINNSGGLVLLRYLVEQLINRNIKCFFLLDERIREIRLVPRESVIYISGNENCRRNFYNQYGDNFEKILCFANLPPTKLLHADVFTFFQNVTLVDIPDQVKLINRPKWLLKRLYLFLIKKNTGKWIVQTSNTAEVLHKKLFVKSTDVVICPFFDETMFPFTNKPKLKAMDYAYIAKSIPEKNHELLIKGWIQLSCFGLRPILHLTMEKCSESVLILLKEARESGCNIINHGFCTLEQVKSLYERCKAVVYTSMNESFGLGMIEAMNMGCDVIAPDKPYVNAICVPSEKFDYNPCSLADAIMRYENGSRKTIPLVTNEIQRFIDIIVGGRIDTE